MRTELAPQMTANPKNSEGRVALSTVAVYWELNLLISGPPASGKSRVRWSTFDRKQTGC